MTPAWLQLIAGLALVIGAAMQLATPAEEADEEESEPWGFNCVKDGGVCDGGSYDGWEEE